MYAHLLYDYPILVTPSDTVDDPGGPYAGIHVDTNGNLALWPINGPQGNLPVTLTVTAGQTLMFGVRRIGVTGSTALCHGLVSSAVRQGPK